CSCRRPALSDQHCHKKKTGKQRNMDKSLQSDAHRSRTTDDSHDGKCPGWAVHVHMDQYSDKHKSERQMRKLCDNQWSKAAQPQAKQKYQCRREVLQTRMFFPDIGWKK